MKILLLNSRAVIRYHFVDDQLPLSLGSQMVDPLTTDRLVLCKSQGPSRFASNPVLFSEQTQRTQRLHGENLKLRYDRPQRSG